MPIDFDYFKGEKNQIIGFVPCVWNPSSPTSADSHNNLIIIKIIK